MNLWTHEAPPDHKIVPQLINAYEEEMEYTYGDGTTLILPVDFLDDFGRHRLPEVIEGSAIIRARTHGHQTVLLRRNSLKYYEFYDGIVYPTSGSSPFDIEIGDQVMTRTTYTTLEQTTNNYSLASFEYQEMISYTSTASALPVAFYEGLVWWNMNLRSLIPTFLDLESPGKVFCRRDKIIRGPDLYHAKQGSKSRNSSQFVVGQSIIGLEVIDLMTGIITSVEGPGDWDWCKKMKTRFFPGFVNGSFKSRSLFEDI